MAIRFNKLTKNSGNEDEAIFKDWVKENELEKIDFKTTPKLTIRLVSPLVVLAQYWPISPKSGSKTPPRYCPRLNPDTQKFEDDIDDPLDAFRGEPLKMRAQKRVLALGIVREWQKGGRNKKAFPVGLLDLPAGTINAMIDIFDINQADPADPEQGCDIRVTFDAAAAGTAKWSLQNAGKSPLTPEERELDVPDLAQIAPNFADKTFAAEYAEAMRRWCVRLGYYVTPIEDAEEKGLTGWDAYTKDANGRPFTDFPELCGAVQNDSTEPAARTATASSKTASPAAQAARTQPTAKPNPADKPRSFPKDDAPVAPAKAARSAAVIRPAPVTEEPDDMEPGLVADDDMDDMSDLSTPPAAAPAQKAPVKVATTAAKKPAVVANPMDDDDSPF